MTITAGELNRATLGRQLLLERQPLDVVEATRRVVALQAQQPASPYLALWNRLSDFDPADLDAAFADRKLVKATLMRFTLHVVHPDDRPAMNLAMQPSLRTRMFDRRFTRSELTIDDADALVPALLEFAATPRTGGEIEAWLDERLDVSPKGVWWALRTFAPLLRAPTGGPWSFDSRTSFVAATTKPTSSDKDEADEALQTLIWRYLGGFGPASVADMALFALVARSRVRTALRGLGDTLEQLEGPTASSCSTFRAPSGRPPTRPPRRGCSRCGTAACWRTPTGPDSPRRSTAPPSPDRTATSCRPCWSTGTSPGCGGRSMAPSRPRPSVACTPPTGRGSPPRRGALQALLADREPRAYRRYDRWWADVPAAEVRLLPA